MSETGVSVWGKTAELPHDATLSQDAHCDVCVVGAGLAGLTTAYMLAQAGKRVVVLEAQDHAAGGETEFTTAHLSCVLDDRFQEVERVHGEEKLRLAVQSHAAAIDEIELVAKREKIACDFRRVDGYLFLGLNDKMELLEKEADCARRVGLGFAWAERAPLPGFDTGRCLRFPDQGQFHPLKYLRGVRDAFLKTGGRIYGGARVERVEGGTPCTVRTRGGASVGADAVVVATNTPINDVVALHTKQAPYMTYALGLAVPSGAVPQALYWDTPDPYHYLRVQPIDQATDLFIVGGEDHKTGQSDDPQACWDRLEAWARKRIASLGEVRFRWSGQVMETIDGLAFLGPDPGGDENVFIATGDSGMGMTHGTIAGMLLRDLILERPNPWAALYDPSRKPIKAAGDYARENLNVAGQYLDWVTGGDVSSADEVKPGHGAVLRRGLKKVALYRDEQGQEHECSAVCPHLGCLVNWNDAEKTWDCPCHGSRFNKEGHVLHGPAVSDLEPAKEASHAS
jgi:glycine/D-amino acid oxidase-like deaminating enzyme/nitrite reductase/ring-hydroxylating ferredoxin subunit